MRPQADRVVPVQPTAGRMQLAEFVKRLLAVAATMSRWLDAMMTLDGKRRDAVARYAENIATTLARAGDTLIELEAKPGDARAARRAMADLGRIRGYIETIVEVLDSHLDGRKLAGLKKRLEQLGTGSPDDLKADAIKARVKDLAAADGYFRALADSLRA